MPVKCDILNIDALTSNLWSWFLPLLSSYSLSDQSKKYCPIVLPKSLVNIRQIARQKFLFWSLVHWLGISDYQVTRLPDETIDILSLGRLTWPLGSEWATYPSSQPPPATGVTSNPEMNAVIWESESDQQSAIKNMMTSESESDQQPWNECCYLGKWKWRWPFFGYGRT